MSLLGGGSVLLKPPPSKEQVESKNKSTVRLHGQIVQTVLAPVRADGCIHSELNDVMLSTAGASNKASPTARTSTASPPLRSPTRLSQGAYQLSIYNIGHIHITRPVSQPQDLLPINRISAPSVRRADPTAGAQGDASCFSMAI